MNKKRWQFGVLIAVMLAVMAATLPYLVRHTKIGLEFKGGYEIVYQALLATEGGKIDHATLVKAANMLAKRANRQGVAEPSVTVLGSDLIRVELAGVNAGDPIITDLQQTNGLPVRLKEKYSETVGGVLGAGDLRDTTRAGLIALGAIFLLLVGLYRGKGLIAVFTTIVSLWLLLAAFVALNATLSLAAIVAFVLAMGIASGANIIAFERAREESSRGYANGAALVQGARKAVRTIFDANAAVLFCAFILLIEGIGPIRGFALTTILSVIFSFIANVVLAGYLVKLRYGDDIGTKLFWRNSRPADGNRSRNLDFLRWGKFATIAGALFLLAGAYAVVTRPLNLDIEFKAGTALDVQIDKPIDQDAATELIAKSGIHPATVAIGGKNQNAVAARFDNVLDTRQVNAVADQFKQAYGPGVTFAENTADPSVAKGLARQSVVVVLLSLLGTAAFIAFRFTPRTAIAAMVSVVSAVLFVIACFALFHLEIDITFIAAMLIVIGYALNEAVVVFDRIRQHIEEGASPSAETINRSINQVVRRSLYTVLTVIAGAVSLYLFGAEPLQMFSVAVLLGLFWGTFASLFVAPRIWFALTPGPRIESSLKPQ